MDDLVAPLVSVITPVHNRASFLDETILSVLDQDYPNIEYIVFDDGSEDDSLEVLAKYAGRITLVSHANMGETRTVNKAFAMSHGDIILVVNSDDPLLAGAIRSGVEMMESRPEILVAYPDWDYIDHNGALMWHQPVPDYDYVRMVREHLCMPGPGAFIRHHALELAGYRDEEFQYVADFEFWLRLGLCGPFARIPRTLATFRVHQDSASMRHRSKRMADEHIRMMDKYFARDDIPPQLRGLRPTAYSWAHFVAAHSAGSRWGSCQHFARSILDDPRTLAIPGRGRAIMHVVAPPSVQKAVRQTKRAAISILRPAKLLARRITEGRGASR